MWRWQKLWLNAWVSHLTIVKTARAIWQWTDKFQGYTGSHLVVLMCKFLSPIQLMLWNVLVAKLCLNTLGRMWFHCLLIEQGHSFYHAHGLRWCFWVINNQQVSWTKLPNCGVIYSDHTGHQNMKLAANHPSMCCKLYALPNFPNLTMCV